MAVENRRAQLVIVGAGPAGLTAALYAERLNIPYILIEKRRFPRDKVCGDGLAPLVFTIMEELDISIGQDDPFYPINEIEFCFSEPGTSETFRSNNATSSRLFNCRRIVFDNWMKERLRQDAIVYGKVIGIDRDKKIIEVLHENQSILVAFQYLLLCTGSGKRLLHSDAASEIPYTAYASRAYVSVEHSGNKNYFEFSSDIAPGYFWIFPVAKNLVNTGVYFHDHSRVDQLYEIHRNKLLKYFPDAENIDFKRWPLRIFSTALHTLSENDIAFAGDAHHSVDPLLGHGIDVAMLEAREQIMALKRQAQFIHDSSILRQIRRLGSESLTYKQILSDCLPVNYRKREFQNYLKHLSEFYHNIRSYIKDQPLSELQSKTIHKAVIDRKAEDQSLHIMNTLVDQGYVVINFLDQEEINTLRSQIGQYSFTFSNNQYREKLKFNSSFFEPDIELKRKFYHSMVDFFNTKLDSILPGYDILITNYWTKNPCDGEVLVHQNWSHVDESRFRSYSIWIPLQDTDEHNGTMEVIPKSHLVFTDPRGLNMEYPYESPFKSIGAAIKKEFLMPIPLKTGQAIIIDDALIHYTGPNQSNQPRLAIQLVVKPREAQGEFYFKHKHKDGENNVEVFEADYDFYIRLSLRTGANTRPDFGITKRFITHHTEMMTWDRFKAIMQQIRVDAVRTTPKYKHQKHHSVFMSMARQIRALLRIN